MTQKLKKIYSCKIILDIFWIKNCNYLSLGLHKGRPATGEAIKREHPALPKLFIFLRVIFTLLDPDPDPLT